MVHPVRVVGIGSKAFLNESCQVWHLLLLVDLSHPHHFKVMEKKKKPSNFFCFLLAVLLLQGFSVGLQIGILQSRITSVLLWE